MARDRQHRHVCVLVLGDIGRSPRMQYHVQSLAEVLTSDMRVESKPLAAIVENPKIKIYGLAEAPILPSSWPRLAFLLYAPFKALFLAMQLLFTLLFTVPAMEAILMQNPPAIPVLPIAAVVSRCRGARLVVDWHNYGYTILALKTGTRHPLYNFAKFVETTFGPWGHRHLCVTHAMQRDLKDNWNIEPLFSHLTHRVLCAAVQERPDLSQRFGISHSDDAQSALTTREGSNYKRRAGRPALIVSSTSWTPDEDFGILFEALQGYEQAAQRDSSLPHVLCIITGKGPERARYEQLVQEQAWQKVAVMTVWLALEDYPKLLASADLGISLHTSSSGLDLPMKVVDMFGSGIPVCAVDFQCLSELVVHDENGAVFKNAQELSQQLQELLRAPDANTKLGQLKTHVQAFRRQGWSANWNQVARPLFELES
ncbi:uncharacterized protein MONBRDRAFT_29828 [Monosiga brevicollis MX1]|uniref:Chitobiosyldiphosphodolichol beta-mannosyltransferase n=1 Tax=Monosiga brevicollis TaxID=81824 RepID=A9VC87_MONBE|nr:uncharacterized protein MONBRDRAFT_29828 [Monosiga brevicollis MX1]EDQ84817.1 predicted protein [Monosiga brevicollis MX1]|eukprot:XP_001750318.1 hypothetical protein [Monosiga brevicollis MX1]